MATSRLGAPTVGAPLTLVLVITCLVHHSTHTIWPVRSLRQTESPRPSSDSDVSDLYLLGLMHGIKVKSGKALKASEQVCLNFSNSVTPSPGGAARPDFV